MATEELHITYRRSGGFAGVVMAAECAAADLPAGQAQLASDLLSGPPEGTPDEGGADGGVPAGADQFTYTLELVQGARRRTLSWSDTTVPDAARPLLATLGSRAQPTRRD